MNQNTDLIEQFFDCLYVPGYCLEVRVLDSVVSYPTLSIVRSQPPNHTTVGGWFTRSDALVCELSRLDKVSAYISVNPVLLGRRPIHAKNTLRVLKRGDFALDSDIHRIRHIIIDIDPIREPGQSKINSTDKELAACIYTRDTIIQEMNLSCFSGVSGNGAFILLPVKEQENTERVSEYIFSFINHISKKYTNKHCMVDTNARNPSRLIAIPGTIKFKGAVESPDRPYRMVTVDTIGGASCSPDRANSISSNGLKQT